ncbi:hypothetical protein [Photobacterium profundum]|nr:hypothetical protein [Photobacterium profundum]
MMSDFFGTFNTQNNPPRSIGVFNGCGIFNGCVANWSAAESHHSAATQS